MSEPPPLFDNAYIFDGEEENDDIFVSAMSVSIITFHNLLQLNVYLI